MVSSETLFMVASIYNYSCWLRFQHLALVGPWFYCRSSWNNKSLIPNSGSQANWFVVPSAGRHSCLDTWKTNLPRTIGDDDLARLNTNRTVMSVWSCSVSERPLAVLLFVSATIVVPFMATSYLLEIHANILDRCAHIGKWKGTHEIKLQMSVYRARAFERLSRAHFQ